MNQKTNSQIQNRTQTQRLKNLSFFFPHEVPQSFQYQDNFFQFPHQNYFPIPYSTYFSNLGHSSFPFGYNHQLIRNSAYSHNSFSNNYLYGLNQYQIDSGIYPQKNSMNTAATTQESNIKIEAYQPYTMGIPGKTLERRLLSLKQPKNIKIEQNQVKVEFIQNQQRNSQNEEKQNLQCNFSSKNLTRAERVQRYLIKKKKRSYKKRIVYQCRKYVADSRLRVKGRFVKRQNRLTQNTPYKFETNNGAKDQQQIKN